MGDIRLKLYVLKYMIRISLFGLLSCTTKTNDTDKKPPATSMCYVYAQDGSEVFLKLNVEKERVTGSLTYAFKEKDRNTGSIFGELVGDTLFATYSYMSEGIHGKKDVVFLKVEDNFVEGRGQVKLQTGEPDLSDKSRIKFSGGILLRQKNCN